MKHNDILQIYPELQVVLLMLHNAGKKSRQGNLRLLHLDTRHANVNMSI